MPEIPELEVYVRRVTAVTAGHVVSGSQLQNAFLLRTVEPGLDDLVGRQLTDARRIGKQLAFCFTGDGAPIWAVLHLMLDGRLDWRKPDRALPKRDGLLRILFGEAGALTFLEKGSRKRASLHLVHDLDEVPRVRGRPVDPLAPEFTVAHLRTALTAKNRQLKGALTDARVIGLGNAFSDEILWTARLPPLKLTERLDEDELIRLHAAIAEALAHWTDVVDRVAGPKFPHDQPKWRKQLRIHHQYEQPCPACQTPIARISYQSRETNYCPTCQTDGKTLADRRRSRFLK